MKMKSRKSVLMIFCLLAVFIAGREAKEKLSADLATQTLATQRAKEESATRSPAQIPPPAQAEVNWSAIPLSQEEQYAAQTLVRLQAQANALANTKEFVAALGKANLQPVIAKDSNTATGTMELVRTSNALPGTRYLHAQFFSDSGEGSILQHISFEIRPSPDSMQRALAWIRAAYGNLGVPEIQREDYVLWRTREHRVISAKRLTAEDLKNNYFNAHSPEDVGSVWVVNELDPEADG